MWQEFLKHYIEDLNEDLPSEDPLKLTVFVDIETEGLSKELNGITVIGTYAEGRYRAFVAGLNLEKGRELLERYPVWVTFGGTSFDLPFIKRYFPELKAPKVHLDLRLILRRAGLKGGLKKIESALGITRKTRGLTGYDAVKLWQKWVLQKNKAALRKLLLYNREDVENLEKVLKIAVEKFLRKKGHAV